MFALVKLVFAYLELFLVFRMFDISDICHGKAGFWMFAALFGFSDVDITDVRPGKAVFRIIAALFRFRIFDISDVCPG